MKANTPDEGRTILVVWQDIANPLRDENGVIQRTDVMNAAGTALIPRYPEFGEHIAIPDPIPTTQAGIDALLTPALENVKLRAQIRANNTEAKTSIRSFVNALNQADRIDFEGTVSIP